MVQNAGNLIGDALPGAPGHVLSQPHVEVITGSSAQRQGPSTPWYRTRRLQVFLLVFLLVLVPGLAWDFLRPAQYRAKATLLTEQPLADVRSPAGRGPDIQHVAIQGRVLLVPELLAETLERAGRQMALTLSSPDELARMLAVTPVPDTNLVELSAEGGEPDQLAPLVNAWIDAYLDLRQRQLESDIGNALGALREEHEALGETLANKTKALERFRSEQDIVTLERDGNEALARLKALQQDLNRARDEALEAEARRTAAEAAVARGDPIVPSGEQSVLDELEARAAELQGKLIELEKRFLPMFLDNHPEYRVIPAQLAALEEQIEQKLARGRKVVLVQGRREVEQARQRVEVLERELAGQKDVASKFTEGFARYQAMQTDLQGLQKMHQETGARVVELEAKGLEKYPPVEVIDRAHRPDRPFHPRYWQDALWVLLAASVAALAAVWLSEFLTRRPRNEGDAVPVTGVRVYAGGQSPAIAGGMPAPSLRAAAPSPAIAGTEPMSLPGAQPRELLPEEVAALWDLAEPMSRQLMALLLSGVSLAECAELGAGDFDLKAGSVRPRGPGPREIPLAPAARELFEASVPLPLWAGADYHQTPAELARRIGLLAHDAGLSQPAEVTAGSLRHSYIAYLVRQGARLTELERILGSIPTAELTRYAAFAPAGQAKPLRDVNTTFPSLKNPKRRDSSATV
jgi:uncharacterized protein involved in exopolysaccharide biosynthesis